MNLGPLGIEMPYRDMADRDDLDLRQELTWLKYSLDVVRRANEMLRNRNAELQRFVTLSMSAMIVILMLFCGAVWAGLIMDGHQHKTPAQKISRREYEDPRCTCRPHPRNCENSDGVWSYRTGKKKEAL